MADKLIFKEADIEKALAELDLGFSIYAEERTKLISNVLERKREISCQVASPNPLYDGIFASGKSYEEVFKLAKTKVWNAFYNSDDGKKLIAQKEKELAEKAKKKAEKEAKKAAEKSKN